MKAIKTQSKDFSFIKQGDSVQKLLRLKNITRIDTAEWGTTCTAEAYTRIMESSYDEAVRNSIEIGMTLEKGPSSGDFMDSLESQGCSLNGPYHFGNKLSKERMLKEASGSIKFLLQGEGHIWTITNGKEHKSQGKTLKLFGWL